MEIAFTSSNKLKLQIEKKQNKLFDRIAGAFLRDPGQYITTILVGNNIALVLYSLNMSILLGILAARLGFDAGGTTQILLQTAISTLVIIFAGEFIPKAVFSNSPNFFLRLFAVPIYFFYIILFPIARFTTWLAIGILRLVGLKVRGEHNIRSFDRVDLTHMLEEAKEHELHMDEEENEIKIFRNALDFSDLRVRDCMVPRVDIEAMDIDSTIEELTRRFVDTNYSRIFIYEGNIDNIVGYVNTKSMFRMPHTIREILKEVDYVPESLSAQKLLTTLIKRNRAVAVVIDEFGGTAGMVSMEDVLEEIFGEIEDEHDENEMVEKPVGSNTYVFSCRLEVEYLNEKYNLGIPESEEYDTLAGDIIYYYEGIPSQGEVVEIEGNEIKILRMSGSKLELARFKKG
jgi:CBS domain containing-hemolysin-like protein